MALYLGILIFAFILTSLAIVPFIDLLYRLHLTYHRPLKPFSTFEAKEFRSIHLHERWKIGTPVGGGVLIIFMVVFLYIVIFPFISKTGLAIVSAYAFKEELNIIFFTFVTFGLLGIYEDIFKTLNFPQFIKSPQTWSRTKSILIITLSFLVSLTLYFNVGIHIINIPYIGVIKTGWGYIPLATLIISAFCKAFDITDGLDGLASGILLVSLLAFWGLSVAALDTVLSVFLALWIGSLLAFLYFNVYPARIWLGNGGSLSFGATLAVTGLLLGKVFALLIVGLVFLIEAATQIAQVISIKLTGKKLFPVTPLHYWLESLGWPEPKVVMRLWLLAILLALVGLWIAYV